MRAFAPADGRVPVVGHDGVGQRAAAVGQIPSWRRVRDLARPSARHVVIAPPPPSPIQIALRRSLDDADDAAWDAAVRRMRVDDERWLARRAQHHRRAVEGLTEYASDDEIHPWAARRAAACGVASVRAGDRRAAYAVCARYAATYGVDAPELPGDADELDVEHALRSMLAPRWWRRRGRTMSLRAGEERAIRRGRVHACRRAPRQQYAVTDVAAALIAARDAATAAMMSRTTLASSDGRTVTLADVAAAGPANPAVRRAELMTHIRGLEEYELSRGRVGLFITWTLPSRWHRMLSAGGPNPQYRLDLGVTPRDGQAELRAQWARARAALARAGVDMAGLRVVEPHHDGTPHWHLLLFVDPARRDDAVRIMRRYALAEAPNEPGAQRVRLTAVRLDPAKGSAAGYVAKYISKSIDGHALDSTVSRADDGAADPVAGRAADNARRVRAWARCWGIRQFQFLGGGPIGLWRELRRLRDPVSDAQVESLRVHADTGEWGPFLWALRSAPDVVLAHAYRSHRTRARQVVGVISAAGQVVATRLVRWRRVGAPWTRENNCTPPGQTGQHVVGIDTAGRPDYWLRPPPGRRRVGLAEAWA